MYFGDAPDGLLLSNRIRTGVAAGTVLAELIEVELVDPFYHRAEVFLLGGDDPGVSLHPGEHFYDHPLVNVFVENQIDHEG